MIQKSAVPHPSSMISRIAAVGEVLAVFLAVFCLIWAIAWLPIGKTERGFLNYTVMIVFPLLILLLTRRNLSEYGLFFRQLKGQVDITLAALLPTFIGSAIYGWLLPLLIPQAIIRWDGALILCLMEAGIFFWVAWALRRKSTLVPFVSILLAAIPLLQAVPFDRLLSFLFYLLFLGPGEEFLFRGYIQSRLNRAFGRPYSFWGVSFGWGVFITALIFGVMHILNPFNPFLGKFDLYIWWGVWTFFGGLVSGYIREKAGSILPTAILHGLPQAIASLMFGFFSVR